MKWSTGTKILMVMLVVAIVGIFASLVLLPIHSGGYAVMQENKEDIKDRVVWQSVVGNIYIGTRLYYQSDEHYFGEVVDISDARMFSDGSIQRAVLIRYPDGNRAWYPRQSLRVAFMTKAE